MGKMVAGIRIFVLADGGMDEIPGAGNAEWISPG
jgi:hypothetical protein